MGSPCHMCDGRPRITTTPIQSANVYRDGRDPKHRATSAARAGVTISERTAPKRFTRTRKHVTGAPFDQRCMVCGGTGETPVSLAPVRDAYVLQQDAAE